MTTNAQEQYFTRLPPRVGATAGNGTVVTQAVSATSQGYDMSVLQFPDESSSAAKGLTVNDLWLDLEAVGGDLYFAFDPAAPGVNTIDDTVANAAATAWVKGNAGIQAGSGATVWNPGHILSGTIRRVRIDRKLDRTIILKAAATKTATLILSQSSQSLPGATPGQ